MRRRIALLFLVAVMVITSVVYMPGATAADTTDTANIELLKKIGVLDDALDLDSPVTRGIFATYAARLLGDVPASTSATAVYFDIAETDACCSAVSLLTSVGLLNGYGDGTFLPDRPITLSEASKVMVDLLGYKYRANINGGYPNGYTLAAQELGLHKNLDLQQVNFYGSDLATLLYNAIDVDVLMENGLIKQDGETSVTMEKVEGRTVMTENLDMYRGEGVIEANAVTNLTGVAVSGNELWLDGFAVTCDNSEYQAMVGYNVEYIYRQSEGSNKRELIYAVPLDGCVFELTGEEFLEIDGLTISYINEADKVKKVNLESTVEFVYNGKVTSFSESYFEDFYSGTIKLIDSDLNGKYDIVNVEEFNSFVARNVNSNQMIADDGVASMYSISLDADDYTMMHLLNDDGKSVNSDYVTPNSVISYFVNDGYFKGYVSKNTVSGNLDKVYASGAMTQYEVAGRLYSLPDNYSGTEANIGDDVTLYIDAFGYIIDLDVNVATDLTVGFLLKGASYSENMTTKYGFDIYTAQKTKITVYAAERVAYNGVSTKIEDLPARLEQSVICYELNDEGLLVTLETPVGYDGYVDGRLLTYFPKGDAFHYSKIFDSNMVYNDSTVMFAMPDPYDAETGEKKFDITESMLNVVTYSNMEDRKSYPIEAYITYGDATSLAAAIIYQAVSNEIPRMDNLATLITINHVIDDNDVEVYKASMLVEGVLKEFNIEDDVKGVSSPSVMKPGDTFRYLTNTEGNISALEMIYTVAKGWGQETNNYDPYGDGGVEVLYGEVISNDGQYLRVSLDDEPYTGFMQDYYAIPMSHYASVTVLTIGGRGCQVTSGTIQSAAVGDYVINYRNAQAAGGFVLIKHE